MDAADNLKVENVNCNKENRKIESNHETDVKGNKENFLEKDENVDQEEKKGKECVDIERSDENHIKSTDFDLLEINVCKKAGETENESNTDSSFATTESSDKDLADNSEKINEVKNISEIDAVLDRSKKREKGFDEENLTLYEACKLGNYNLVEKMLKMTTEEVNKQDEEGWSCLHETCIHTCQFTNIAELLLKHGANPNVQDNSGETPLHGAVLFHYIDNIKLLMKYKADPTLCNLEGVSSQLIAERSHDDDMSKLLGLSIKKKKTTNRRKSQLKKGVSASKKRNVLPYTPSPLSSPSILKKRKRDSESEEENSSSPKKRITFSLDID